MPAPSSDSSPRAERLQKLLAAAGIGSRRSCEEYITTGRVTVDGQVVTQLGVKVDLDRQQVTVDGERLRPHKKVYYLVNKPMGCLCTTSDPAGRPRVVDLVPPSEARLFTVGRLDEHTEGLILVTNDGELAHRLAHPRFQVERVYRALVAGQPTLLTLDELRKGLHFTEGKFRVRDARIVKSQGHSTILELVLTEGQNREVRRLLARVGHKVMALKRVAFGPLKLADLDPSAYRPLRSDEVQRLHEFVSGEHRPQRRTQRPPGKKPPGDRPARPRRPEDRARPPRAERPAQEGRARPPAARPAGTARPAGAARPARRPPNSAPPRGRPPSKRPPRQGKRGG